MIEPHLRMKSGPRPFLKYCWCGVWELVVPVCEKGQPILILYANPLRENNRRSLTGTGNLSEYHRSFYRHLPPLKIIEQKRLLPILEVIGAAIQEKFRKISHPGPSEDSRGGISGISSRKTPTVRQRLRNLPRNCICLHRVQPMS